MTNLQKLEELNERATADIDAAYKEVFRVCKKPQRNFVMTIPVRQTDSDVVICKGLKAGEDVSGPLPHLLRLWRASKAMSEASTGNSTASKEEWQASLALKEALTALEEMELG